MSRALSRRTDPSTSHQAAAKLGTAFLESVVLQQLRRHGSATTLELSERTGIARVSISPRLRPLANRGLVRESGTRRGGIVWEAADEQLTLDYAPACIPDTLRVSHALKVLP